MNGKQSKKLMRIARSMTIGKSKKETDRVYERLKLIHKQK